MVNKFQREDGEFLGEEITTFKRYIEENNVYTDNNFEFFEDNVNYYSIRHTYPHFFSAGRLFQVNSNYVETDEMIRNQDLYAASIKWASRTIHPEDSEYVIKEEKYRYLEGNDSRVKELADYLNKFDIGEYHCIDILIYSQNSLLKFLPGKNFTFTWRKDCTKYMGRLLDNIFLENKYNKDNVRKFDNYEIHKLLNLDGADKNVMDIIVGEWERKNG